jgi:hypothetical protein
MKKIIYLFIVAVMIAGCGITKPGVGVPTKATTYKAMYEEKPVSILALPPINRSTKVEAKELFYSSLVVPLTQKGYYVMSPFLAMEILKEESAYDTEMFVNNSMKEVGRLFGVDAVLFTTIHEWTKSTLGSQVVVRIEYLLKSTKTDEVLFNRIGNITFDLSVNSGNAFADLIGGMLATALTKEIDAARSCNTYSLSDLPLGKYSPSYLQDGGTASKAKEFSVVLQ